MALNELIRILFIMFSAVSQATLEAQDGQETTTQDPTKIKYVVGQDTLANVYNVLAMDCESVAMQLKAPQNLKTNVGEAYKQEYMTSDYITHMTQICTRVGNLLEKATILEPQICSSCPPTAVQVASTSNWSNAGDSTKPCESESTQYVAIYVVVGIIVTIGVLFLLWRYRRRRPSSNIKEFLPCLSPTTAQN